MTAHTRTQSAADTGAASSSSSSPASLTTPERKPLLVRWGRKIGTTFVDGVKVCSPGDPDYEDEYAYACYALEHYGHPLPYVRSKEERAAGTSPRTSTEVR